MSGTRVPDEAWLTQAIYAADVDVHQGRDTLVQIFRVVELLPGPRYRLLAQRVEWARPPGSMYLDPEPLSVTHRQVGMFDTARAVLRAIDPYSEESTIDAHATHRPGRAEVEAERAARRAWPSQVRQALGSAVAAHARQATGLLRQQPEPGPSACRLCHGEGAPNAGDLTAAGLDGPRPVCPVCMGTGVCPGAVTLHVHVSGGDTLHVSTSPAAFTGLAPVAGDIDWHRTGAGICFRADPRAPLRTMATNAGLDPDGLLARLGQRAHLDFELPEPTVRCRIPTPGDTLGGGAGGDTPWPGLLPTPGEIAEDITTQLDAFSFRLRCRRARRGLPGDDGAVVGERVSLSAMPPFHETVSEAMALAGRVGGSIIIGSDHLGMGDARIEVSLLDGATTEPRLLASYDDVHGTLIDAIDELQHQVNRQ